MEGYQSDLAYIHDVGFGGFAEQSATGLLKILRDAGITSGLIVDLGCGSGIWAAKLLDAGYDVLGVDQSAAMAQLARRKAPRGRFIHSSFLDAKLPACSAVTALGEVFNYICDTRNDKRALLALFSRVHEVLQPGGLFIFDVAEPGRGKGGYQRYVEGEDWAVLFEVKEDKPKKQLIRNITTFRQQGKLYRREQETHRLQLYTGRELAVELRRIGFRVRLLRGYGAYRFRPACVGLVASR